MSSATQAQVCQRELIRAEKLGTEYFIAKARADSLMEAPAAEYCPAAKHEHSVLQSYNKALYEAAKCYDRKGIDDKYGELDDKINMDKQGMLLESYYMDCEYNLHN